MKSWLSEAKKSPKCFPMGAKMDQKAIKKVPKTHPKNNFEKRYPKNVLWKSFGAVFGSPWLALCTSGADYTSKRRGEGVPGKGREGVNPFPKGCGGCGTKDEGSAAI